MSKNGFGKQGNAILRRRWLAREAKKERMSKMLGEKKAEIAKRVKEKITNEAEASRQNEHSNDPCDGCPVGGGCIYTACRLGG